MPRATERHTVYALVTSHAYRPTPPTALILSSDPLGGALLAASAELAGLVPTFPAPAETARDALRRTRPVLVIAEREFVARDETCLGPALMQGARLVFVARNAHAETIGDLAKRYRGAALVLPRDLERIREVMLGASRELQRR